ncbi:MAG: thioredoxin domain-containing protein [Betaproteobacteria bacterium]|nr:thioredoxin domain-containing protein [Betaproteobacteria bacterium]
MIHSNSPYLLSHAHNPVDWYPWGPEALEKAKRENKLIFLSVGYSTCYWCHVAERTIYSKPEFARWMNAWFVNIKVDREQRPDLDRIYMLATQIMTGRGGWPNNLFLTPDLRPVFAGSYFPPHDDDFGRTGFSTILRTLHQTWTTDRKRLTDIGERVHASLRDYQQRSTSGTQRALNPGEWLTAAATSLIARADRKHGGLASSGSTKFPRAPALELLLAHYRIHRDRASLDLLTQHLDAMAYGGIYDHLAGGFHRYTVEPSWSIPHFEKMLYDNAQLMKIYAEAFAITRNPLYRFVAEDVAAYLARQMMAGGGGFYTAQDSEVKGKEGASYVWTRTEIVSILRGKSAERFFDIFALTPMPANVVAESLETKPSAEEEGVIRFRLPVAETLKRARSADVVTLLAGTRPLRQELLLARDRRPQPLRDDKIIVGLNGLAIEAFTEAGRILGNQEYISIARRSAEYIWAVAYSAKSESLKHEIFQGRVQTDGFLDDYALLGRAYISLYGATRQQVWLDRAVKLGDTLLKRFARPDGALLTSTSGKDLLITPLDDGDNAQPSGTSAAVELLLRLAKTGGKTGYAEAAAKIVQRLGGQLDAQPHGWSTLVVAANANKFEPSIAALGGPGSASVQAGGLPDFRPPVTADHVRVRATASSADDFYRIEITLDIDRGYHVNANPASFPYLVPTNVSLDGITPISVDYPRPITFKPNFARDGIKVYEGKPTIAVRVAKKELPKTGSLRARVTAQACDDQVCLPPSEFPLSIDPPDARTGAALK